MPLDLNVFTKNKEFITKAAACIEEAIKSTYGHELTDCPDALLKDMAEGTGNTIGRAIFEYLKLKKENQGDAI